MKQKSRREPAEEQQAPVVDKVCDLTCIMEFLYDMHLDKVFVLYVI
jgi:hypothetical protein